MFIIFLEPESPQDKSPAGDQLWNSGREYWIFSHFGNREGVISDPGYCYKIMLSWKQICRWCLDTNQNAWCKCKTIHCVINSELDQQHIHKYKNYFCIYVYVVVNFLSQVIFVFLLVLGMTMFANKVETRRKDKNYLRD